MWEAAAILFIIVGALLWIDSLRARERAVEAGRSACARYDLQFLDETVSFARLRLARDEEGRLRIVRTYTFERSEERRVGKDRRSLCDWSSDVCSSDLSRGHPLHHRRRVAVDRQPSRSGASRGGRALGLRAL